MNRTSSPASKCNALYCVSVLCYNTRMRKLGQTEGPSPVLRARVTEDVYREALRLSKKLGMNISEFVRLAIEEKVRSLSKAR